MTSEQLAAFTQKLDITPQSILIFRYPTGRPDSTAIADALITLLQDFPVPAIILPDDGITAEVLSPDAAQQLISDLLDTFGIRLSSCQSQPSRCRDY